MNRIDEQAILATDIQDMIEPCVYCPSDLEALAATGLTLLAGDYNSPDDDSQDSFVLCCGRLRALEEALGRTPMDISRLPSGSLEWIGAYVDELANFFSPQQLRLITLRSNEGKSVTQIGTAQADTTFGDDIAYPERGQMILDIMSCHHGHLTVEALEGSNDSSLRRIFRIRVLREPIGGVYPKHKLVDA